MMCVMICQFVCPNPKCGGHSAGFETSVARAQHMASVKCSFRCRTCKQLFPTPQEFVAHEYDAGHTNVNVQDKELNALRKNLAPQRAKPKPKPPKASASAAASVPRKGGGSESGSGTYCCPFPK